MANLQIDDRLIEGAHRLGDHKSNDQAARVALKEYVQCRKQHRILEDFGTVDFDPEYDYKAGSATPSNVISCADGALTLPRFSPQIPPR